MSTLSPQTFADKLFPKRLGRISRSQFTKEAGDHGLTPEQAMDLTWTDMKGRQWSVLSRLGYLHLTADKPPRNEQLLTMALRHHGALGLRRQTQPGEPDLLWSWLGYSSLKLSSASTVEEMTTAFIPARHPNPDLPASGCGLVGDGGWADTALGMFEALIKRQDIPARAEQCIMHWMQSNLLANDPQTTNRQHCWYGLGRFESGTGSGTGNYDHSQPQVEWGDKRVPWVKGGYRMSTRRPPMVGERFNEAWSRLLGLSTLCVLRSATVDTAATFPTMIDPQAPEPNLIHCLDAQSVGAMEDHLRTCLLVRRDQRPHGTTIGVLNLWLQAPAHLQGLTDEEQNRMVRRLCGPVTNLQPGEPTGPGWNSWLDWNTHLATPALLSWTKARQLEKAFSETTPPPKPFRPARM